MDQKMQDKLLELLKTPSPSGDTERAIRFMEKEFKALKIPTKRLNKGALIATLKGEDDENAVLLSGHVDTLGLMVKEIKGNGRLKTTQIGGFPWTAVEGEYVTVAASNGKEYTGTMLCVKASTHVHRDVNDTTRADDTVEVRLDEKVKTADDVKKLGICVGDFIYLEPKAEITKSGFVKSRHLDDKACVINMLEVATKLAKKKSKPKRTVHFFISNYEEVGHGASVAMPANVKEMLVIDMAAVGSGQTSDEYSVTICAKDSSGPYDLEFKKALVAVAKAKKIPYQVDIYPYYGSDGSAALRAGHDVRVALIGPGVDASHSWERTHLEALDATTALTLAYLEK